MARARAMALFAAVLVAGCAARALPDERVASTVADLLGLAPGDLTVVRRTDRGSGTDYELRGRDGATAFCEVNASDPNSAEYRAEMAAAPPGTSPDEIVLRGRADLPGGMSLLGRSRAGAYTCR